MKWEAHADQLGDVVRECAEGGHGWLQGGHLAKSRSEKSRRREEGERGPKRWRGKTDPASQELQAAARQKTAAQYYNHISK
jgi:hypothetical protein